MNEFTPEYFQCMAELEDHHPWTRAMRRLTLALLRDLSGTDHGRILDIGCGTGRFLCEWARYNSPSFACGADLHLDALKYAQTRCTAHWLAASAAALPFQPGSFHAIHCGDVLQHLSFIETTQALDLFRDLLTPKGWLALRVGATHLFRNPPAKDYAHPFTPGGVTSHLLARGFRIRFLSRVNALPSLWTDISELMRNRPVSSGPVKGIECRQEQQYRSKILNAYLKYEYLWLFRTRIPLPTGHTIICIAEKM